MRTMKTYDEIRQERKGAGLCQCDRCLEIAHDLETIKAYLEDLQQRGHHD